MRVRYSGEEAENRVSLEDCTARGLPDINDCINAFVPALHAMLCMLDVPVVVPDADVDGELLNTLIKRPRTDLRRPHRKP